MTSVFSLFSATENTEKGKSSRHNNVAQTSATEVTERLCVRCVKGESHGGHEGPILIAAGPRCATLPRWGGRERGLVGTRCARPESHHPGRSEVGRAHLRRREDLL